MIRWPFSRSRDDPATRPELPRPYDDEAADRFYNLIFCDDPRLPRREREQLSGPWRVLSGPPPRSSALQTIVAADGADSRARALAAHLLRSRREQPARRCTLAAVIEVALPQGLELLAAYADGAVRYQDAAGRAQVFDVGPSTVQALAREMVAHGEAFACRHEPWTRPRLPPPRNGELRISMLASDGLRFVEGSFAALQSDADIATIIGRATRLLRRLQAPAPEEP